MVKLSVRNFNSTKQACGVYLDMIVVHNVGTDYTINISVASPEICFTT